MKVRKKRPTVLNKEEEKMKEEKEKKVGRWFVWGCWSWAS
jgi:hypothetical protein